MFFYSQNIGSFREAKKIKNERCSPKELYAHPYGFG